jgi:hypothetical protein
MPTPCRYCEGRQKITVRTRRSVGVRTEIECPICVPSDTSIPRAVDIATVWLEDATTLMASCGVGQPVLDKVELAHALLKEATTP